MAMEFFLREVWPLLRDATLHIIAGARHEQYAIDADLTQPGIELEASLPTSVPRTSVPPSWLRRWSLPPAPTSRFWRRWRWAKPWSARRRGSTGSI